MVAALVSLGAMMPDQDQTSGWLYTLLMDSRQQSTEQHARLRDEMSIGFERMRIDMKTFAAQADRNDSRIAVLESRMNTYDTRTIPKGVWASIIASGTFFALAEIVRYLSR